MDLQSRARAGAAREIDGLRDKAWRLAREVALRHPQALALACTRAGGDDAAAMAWAWIDMIRDGDIDLRATPVAEIVELLGIRPGETGGPLQRRLAQLAMILEAIADEEIFAHAVDIVDADAQEAA
jgi:hypothetical protein